MSQSHPDVSSHALDLRRPAQEPAEPQAEDHEADALKLEVIAALTTLRRSFEHRELYDANMLQSARDFVADVERRLSRKDLYVVVVGERHSGKSTLLDAIVGDRFLGQARASIATITLLRRRAVQSYTARFDSGAVEDFSKLVPDRSAEFAARVSALEAALEDAMRACTAARGELRLAMEALDRMQFDCELQQGKLEGAQEAAATSAIELASAKQDADRAEREYLELERTIPEAVRRAPPRWAVWLWLVRALFLLFRRQHWDSYRALGQKRDERKAAQLAARRGAERYADARLEAESELRPLEQRTRSAGARRKAAEEALLRAETERDRLRAELEVLRSEREHHESERLHRFYANLAALAGERGRQRGLVELAIDYPAKLLPDDVTIIDLPAAARSDGAEWDFIRQQADGCILVSELDRAVSESSKQLLRQLREVVPHLLLVLTKMDQAYRAAAKRGGAEAWEQVNHARRIGTRRFARELGREPDSVLSLAVAAEAALTDPDSELAEHFEAETAKLFQLLRQERAMILGAHAASAIRRSIAGISQAEARAEAAHRQRIAELESSRTPEPLGFGRERIASQSDAMDSAAHEAVSAGIAAVQAGFVLLRKLGEQSLDGCARPSELEPAAERLARELSEQAAAVRRSGYLELESAIERAVGALAAQVLQKVRGRYGLLHEVRHESHSAARLGAPDDARADFSALVPEIRSALRAFRRGRLTLGLSGALSGAAAGVFVHPFAGPAVGGALGGLLFLAQRETRLREQTLDAVKAALARQEQRYLEELKAGEADVAAAIRSATERSLDRAVQRFGRWLSEPLQAEQEAIDTEQHELAELVRLRRALADHDDELARCLSAAAGASFGLCR